MNLPGTFGLPLGRLVRRQFDAAAATFDSADAVHAEARERLLERLELFALEPAWVVDLGAATGNASVALASRYPRARIVAADLSFAMTREATRKRDGANIVPVQCNAHALPCRDASVDLVFGNLLLPWVAPERVFAECARVLRAGGLALFTSFGPDTLVELRRAWARVDDRVHVHGFVDMHDLGDLALRAGLAEPVVDVDRLTVSYANLGQLLADLRATGCGNCAVGRPEGLTSRARWRAFETAFAARADQDGVTVTVELVYAQAWGSGALARPRPAGNGVVRVAAADVARAAKRGPAEDG